MNFLFLFIEILKNGKHGRIKDYTDLARLFVFLLQSLFLHALSY